MSAIKTKTQIKGYRPDPSRYIAILKDRVKTPFSNKHFLHCELRWAALFCCEEAFTANEIISRSTLNSRSLAKFMAYYGIDINRRDLIHKEVN
jgi:hypothetical protein